MFRIVSSVLCTALLGLTPTLVQAAAAQELDVAGAWVFTVESPNGTGTRQVTIVQQGDSISGTISSSRATGDFTGLLDGDQIRFTVVLAMESGPFPVTYEATVVDDEMEGIIDFGDYGMGTFTGRKTKLEPATVTAPLLRSGAIAALDLPPVTRSTFARAL